MPRAPRLPSLHAETGSRQAALAIALARVRASAAWTADVGEAELCMHHPPFGLRDQSARIKGILWNAIPRHNTSGDASNATMLRSSDGLLVSGRRLAGGGAAARPPENETEMLQACLQLAQLFKRITGRPSRVHHGSCAVVGSSGGLTGSGQGALIDAHDAVYRFNNAPVGGPYQVDVGNRTSVWVASHVPWRGQARRVAALTASRGTASEESAALYCFNPWLGACHVDAMGGKRLGVQAPLLISPALVTAMMQIQITSGGKSGGVVRPSTGLMGVGLALASCARVSLFGFGNDSDPGMQGHCNHYYDCRTNQTNYFAGRMGYHDWHGQWRALAALIELGAMRYHPPTGKPNTFQARPPAPKPLSGRAARRGAAAAVARATATTAAIAAASGRNHTAAGGRLGGRGGGGGGGGKSTKAAGTKGSAKGSSRRAGAAAATTAAARTS
jgi:hypothetical protein